MPVTANSTRDTMRRLQRALYLAAKRSAGRRFHVLYDKLYRKDILTRAWAEVKANQGAAGADGADPCRHRSPWRRSVSRRATGRVAGSALSAAGSAAGLYPEAWQAERSSAAGHSGRERPRRTAGH